MIKLEKSLLTLLLVLSLASCSFFKTYDRREKYLEAEVQDVVTIPEGLDGQSLFSSTETIWNAQPRPWANFS